MKSITVEIEQPITEYCTKCSYEGFYSFYANRVKCPKCGEASVVGGERQKNDIVSVSMHQASYDLLHPNKKQYCYTFYNLPKQFKTSYVIDDEIDYSDPLSSAIELNDIIGSYIYNSSKEKIKEVVEWLEDNEEDQEDKRRRRKIHKLKRELYKELYS